jgi:hypothetical protein
VATIYRTRSPLVQALLRASAGSASATFKDHPGWGIDPKGKAARSVAKRVAGTIAADWPRLSAIAMAEAGMVATPVTPISQGRPDVAGGGVVDPTAGSRLQPSTARSVGLGEHVAPGPARARQRTATRAMKQLQKAIGGLVGQTKRDAKHGVLGPWEAAIRAAALVDVLRLIDRISNQRTL